MLIEQLVNYLQEILNVTIVVSQWDEGGRLPFFLQDNYAYYRTEIHGMNLLLMIDAGNEEYSPATIRKHVDLVRAKCGSEVVYAREQVTSYDRKRLIEHHVPFIVPGNQLYLPMLAIDLREHFRKQRQTTHKFSPATQALVLYWIHNNSDRAKGITTPTEMAKILGYSKMTMSRAFKEVDAALGEVHASNKTGNVMQYDLTGHELWQKLQPYWRSPISQRHYLLKTDFDRGLRLRAGLTALAAYSMLAEPGHEVFAVSQSEWKVFGQIREVLLLDRPDTQTVEVEVWGYPPNLFAQNGLVDRLSLYLSLRESKDERIESALEELLEGMKW